MRRQLFILFFILLSFNALGAGQLGNSVRERVAQCMTRFVEREVAKCPVTVKRSTVTDSKVTIYASLSMSYYPVRPDNLAELKDSIREILPPAMRNRTIDIVSEGHSLEFFIPPYYRSKKSAEPAKPQPQSSKSKKAKKKKAKKATPKAPSTNEGSRYFTNSTSSSVPLVRYPGRPFRITNGLQGRHIALWQSHGRYFKQKENEWQWQRSLLWQTVEDLYTQSYVLPYLVPMLENAGANVLLPRERDFSSFESIADNDRGIDTESTYSEKNGSEKWASAEAGFAHRKEIYEMFDNPFRDGTTRKIATVHSPQYSESTATWTLPIEKDGEYAVYVSYRSYPQSATDAAYTVLHDGMKTKVSVNQRMGGGTWIYIGTYFFRGGEKGAQITLSNRSSCTSACVSADAVKIGGGMGNIARNVCDSLQKVLRDPTADYTPLTSSLPRFCEGSRYWLQWAGFDREIYSAKKGGDDYKDDFMSRGRWAVDMMGGSERLKDSIGKGIPLDMCLAFHTDAGITPDSTTVGTLGIFFTRNHSGKFDGKISRYVSRDLTDVVMSQIVGDLRKTFDPQWRRRGMWNKSYYEARVPNAPTMLLELLSHQNLSDMTYGLDPKFRFTVSRAVYKGILRHLSTQYGVGYTVQPLPVTAFSCVPASSSSVRLSWNPQTDPLEPSAAPTAYVLYTRRDGGSFDSGRKVDGTEITVEQLPGIIYSYKVTALNDGGESFPSEILSAATAKEAKGLVYVINGFDRLSAPETREDGFHNEFDSGVAYLRDVAFIGTQRVFDLEQRKNREELYALGCSMNDMEGRTVGGNTFDYPYLYGQSLLDAGYSFCSSSALAVENGYTPLDGADAVCLILGKQRTVKPLYGNGETRFACFTDDMEQTLQKYLSSGGKLMVSGSYLGYDLMKSPFHDEDDEKFAMETLHITHAGSSDPSKTPHLTGFGKGKNAEYTLNTSYCEEQYTLNSVDALRPSGKGAKILMKYYGSRLPAAVGYEGTGRSVVLGFPFETVDGRDSRDRLMKEILDFLSVKTTLKADN